MKQFVFASLIIAAFCVAPSPLSAADGKLTDKVIEVLKANAKGDCPARLMASILRSQCEQQISVIQKRLQSLGPIEKAEFKGMERLPSGVDAEIYAVTFENGSMIWAAAANSEGKLNVMWSPG